MSLRTGITTVLTDGLPTFRVIGYPASLDNVTQPTVAVWATAVDRLEDAPVGHYLVTYTLMIFSPYEDPALADDDLDDSLQAVLAVLWDNATYLVSDAERTVSQDNTIHAWTLTVSAGITITEA